MKKNRLIMGIVYALLLCVMVLVVFIVKNNQLSVFLILNNDGYMISKNDVTKNLLKDSVNTSDSAITAVPFSISDTIYQKSGSFYIGDEKTPANDIFPLFINNASTLMTLTDKPNLITNDFVYTKAYSGLYINDGVSFNPDMERAYREQFILMDLTNGLYINAKEIKVSGSFFVEKNIPHNSIIRFMENEIRYYTLEENIFKLYSIKPVAEKSILEIDGKEYLYYDFLEKLGLYQKEKLREKDNKKEDPLKQNLEINYTSPNKNNTAEGKQQLGIIGSENNADQNAPEPDADIPQQAENTPSQQSSAQHQPAPKSDIPAKHTDSGKPKSKPATSSQAISTQEAKPAEPAAAAAVAKPNDLPNKMPDASSSNGSSPQDDSTQVEPPANPPPIIKDWVKPKVTLDINNITATVYAIVAPGMVIENPQFLYRTGVSFEVYDSDKKLVMKKGYTKSDDVSVGPLKPSTKYTLDVKMAYIDMNGLKVEETIVEGKELTTLDLSNLPPLRFNWQNGNIFYNKIQLKDLTISNAIKSTTQATDESGKPITKYTYIESVQYMNKVEVVFTQKDDDSKVYRITVSSKDLNSLRLGKAILYESTGVIPSDKEYYYEFVCYDRFGNILPQEGVLRGITHTCKQPPKAEINILKNEIKNVEASIKLSNADSADVRANSTFFTVYDSNNNPVKTRIQRKNAEGIFVTDNNESEIHYIDQDINTIRFLDLIDYEVYSIKVISTYNINDSMGWYDNGIIGEARFTTTPISSLGLAFFDVELKNLGSNQAVFSVKLNKDRTDSRLVNLISDIDFSIIKKENNDGTGIKIQYEYDNTSVSAIDATGLVSVTQSAIEYMKTNNASITFSAINLNSQTEYKLNIVPKAIMGSVDHQIYREISTYYTPKTFTTMKITPVINIDAIYASADFIKLYGVSVQDPDNSIISYPVSVAVYDENGSQIDTIDIPSPDGIDVIEIQKLKRDKPYTFKFFAKEYNNGFDMKTYRKNQELYYSELADKMQPLVIVTREAVSGSIQILQMDSNKMLSRVEVAPTSISPTGITLNTNKYRFNNTMTTKKGSVYQAKFAMNVDFGYQNTNAFQIGFSGNKTTTYKIYLSDPDLNPSAQPIGSTTINAATLGTERSRWTDIILLNNGVNLTGKQRLYIIANNTDTSNTIHYFWGIRFMETRQSDSSHYYANINASVIDSQNELGPIPAYYIKVYKNGVWVDTRRHQWTIGENGKFILKMFQVRADKTEVLVDEKEFTGQERSIDTDFYYEVEKGYNNYTFELSARVFDYEIKLGKEDFSTEKEIIAIRTQDDLLNIRYGLDKKYFVLNDITLASGVSNITNSAPSPYFTGELDFRGHKLTSNSGGALITNIGYRGVLKNMVFTYASTWGTTAEARTDRLVNYNSGTIQNILFIRNNGNAGTQTNKNDSSTICYMNNESGVIENFVVNLKDPLISTNYSSGVCEYNKGIIRNGYIYGAPIRMTSREYLTEEQYSANTIMGAISSVNYADGIIENVFSLPNIETRAVLSANDYAFNLVGINEGTLKNSFSAGDVYYGGLIREGFGPAYRSRYTGNASNTYYYSENNYGKTDNRRISKLVLYDKLWYNRVLDNQQSSKVGQFEYEPVQMGYYPHVAWPDLMPLQEYLPLPGLSPSDNINIVDAQVIEQNDDSAKAVITFNNPDHFNITAIRAQWLNIDVLSQEEDGKFYRVTVRITKPAVTKYYSSYNITGFDYSLGFQGMTRTVTYTDDYYPTIPVEFYMPISSEAEFASIKNDLQQNYRLMKDLNFFGYAPTVPVIPAPNLTMDPNNASFALDAFSGKLDGNNFTISSIDAGTYGYVIGKLTGTVKNLTVKDLNLNEGNSLYKGFIGRMLTGSVVDNVHIIGMEAVSYQQCGAITSDIYASTIMNSSAHNIKITSTSDGNYTQYIGGLVGRQRSTAMNNITILNCYTDGVNLNILSAGDCGGAGGLLGFARAGAEIRHVYAINGSIDTAYKNVGGLIGAIDTNTNYQSSLYSLKDFYVDVDITSITERVGGVMGFTNVKNSEDNVNGLVLGNVFTSKPNANDVSRYFGRGVSPTPSAIKLYGYEYSLLNGILNKDSELKTYNQLTDVNTYSQGGALEWDKDFVVDTQKLSQGVMPKLKKVSGNELVPYQEDYKLENSEIKISEVTSRPYSSGNLYIVKIEATHNADIVITGAKFSGLKAADLGGQGQAVTILKSANGTTLEYVLDIEGYYDCYYLTGIDYVENGEAKSQTMKLSVGIQPQYLQISSASQWNNLMSDDSIRGKRYNIQIIGDLDFTPFRGIAASGVIINSLIGDDKNNWKTIKGINMTSGESLVEAAYGDISYLKFEDISLTKDKQNHPEPTNGFGLFGTVTGDIYNVDFNNVSINTYNSAFVGLAAMEYGNAHNINLNKIFIKTTFNPVPTRRAAGGLTGRLSGAGSVYDVTAQNMSVEGRDYVGGIVGMQEDGRNLWNITMQNIVVSALSSSATGNYVGGIAGYANSGSLANKYGNNLVRQAVITGNQYVGGIEGIGNITGDNTLTSQQNDNYLTKAENVFVVGTGPLIGGIAGEGEIYRAELRNSTVYGTYYVGGITGNGAVQAASSLDSVIGTVFDRSKTDTGNKIFQNAVAQKQAYYTTLKSKTTDSAITTVYNKAIEMLGYLTTSTRNASWSTTSFSGSTNTRVGGISGRTLSVYNSIASNCKIGGYGAMNVGGIVGLVEGSSSNVLWPYRVISSGTQNCTVDGAENVGGVAGFYNRGYMESCYSNADVTASRSSAGGLIGSVKANGLGSVSETPYASHLFFVGTVTAPDYAGGIIGRMQQDLYNINEGWLMAGNVVATNASSKGAYHVNRQLGDTRKITKAGLYNNSILTINNVTKKGSELSPLELLETSILDTATLKTENVYTTQLGWSAGLGTTASNYTTRYWMYNGLANGYMPYLDYVPTRVYGMDYGYKVMKYQEGYLPDAVNTTKAAIDINGNYIYRYETYQGGVPVPGSGATIIKKSMLLRTNAVDLPHAEFYAVDADKLNIEFSLENPSATFTVSVAGQQVVKNPIDKRTFTLNYDFKRELEITVSNGVSELKYNVYPEDVRRDIMTWKSDYYYIAAEGVKGSRPDISGVFVNIYNGKMLDGNGNILDAKTGEKLGTITGVSLNDQALPTSSIVYDNCKIETFKNYSLVDGVLRDKLRLYVKNGELSAISSNLPAIMDSFILDNYNGNSYCSVLGTDGIIVDMTDNGLNMPNEIENSSIQYMTNNLNTTSHIVLIRYNDGAVAGFNYITGEMLDIESPRGVSAQGYSATGKKERSTNSLMTNFSSMYVDVMAFEADLDAIGWAAVNGTNTDNGTAVSPNGGTFNEDAESAMKMYLEGSFIMEDGSQAADSEKLKQISGGVASEVNGQNSQNTDNTLSGDTSNLPSADNNSMSGIPPSNLINGQNSDAINQATMTNEAVSKVTTQGAITDASEINTLVEKSLQPGGELEEAFNAAILKLVDLGIDSKQASQIVKASIIKAAELGMTNDSIKSLLDKAVQNTVEQLKTGSKLDTATIVDVLEKAMDYQAKETSDNSKMEANITDESSKPTEKTQVDQNRYIPVYDAIQARYILFDKKDLLDKNADKIESVNDKVEKSGHMVNYHPKQKVDKDKPDDANIYGYLLVFGAIAGISLLLGYMIINRRKEANP